MIRACSALIPRLDEEHLDDCIWRRMHQRVLSASMYDTYFALICATWDVPNNPLRAIVRA